MAEKAKFDREAAFKSIIGAGRQSENAVVAEEKNAKKNSDRVQRAYYLDRDIDKAEEKINFFGFLPVLVLTKGCFGAILTKQPFRGVLCNLT